jgi:hypothetical protein
VLTWPQGALQSAGTVTGTYTDHGCNIAVYQCDLGRATVLPGAGTINQETLRSISLDFSFRSFTFGCG